jgi:hypothetical protein
VFGAKQSYHSRFSCEDDSLAAARPQLIDITLLQTQRPLPNSLHSYTIEPPSKYPRG